jgi:hypothetical protein
MTIRTSTDDSSLESFNLHPQTHRKAKVWTKQW